MIIYRDNGYKFVHLVSQDEATRSIVSKMESKVNEK